jgi:hypothetical protein
VRFMLSTRRISSSRSGIVRDGCAESSPVSG